jgi:hypothetical protein
LAKGKIPRDFADNFYEPSTREKQLQKRRIWKANFPKNICALPLLHVVDLTPEIKDFPSWKLRAIVVVVKDDTLAIRFSRGKN